MDAESAKSTVDWLTIVLALLGTLLGAGVGTYGGVFLLNRRTESKTSGVRNIAINMLNKIKEYDKAGNTYQVIQEDFNKTFSTAEKRAVLVTLHKIGVPVELPFQQPFNIRKISFSQEKIDSREINDMISQIKSGNCDHLFFSDPDVYFNQDNKIKAIRSLAKGFVENVLKKSSIIRKDDNTFERLLPNEWLNKISPGEYNVLLVFISKTYSSLYYNSDDQPDNDKMASLTKEIDLGLWDTYLLWDNSSYQNMHKQIIVNDVIIDIARSGNIMNLLPPFNK